MATNNEFYRPSGVIIETLKMTNFDKSKTEDLSQICNEINIYEDIYQSQIMGDITISDTRELIQFFPIVGDETIEIRFRVPTREKEFAIDFNEMRIYKIDDRSSDGSQIGKVQSFKLYFISQELIHNLNTAISRSYNTKTVKQIVDSVYNEYVITDKPIEIEDTLGTLKIVLPNWNPIKTINWLATNKAINKDNDADFVFYEASNKSQGPKFYFKSLKTLIKQAPTFKLTFEMQNLEKDDIKISGGVDIATYSKNIEDFQFKKHGNVLNNTNSGQYKQHWIYHDPLRKKFVISKPVHDEDFLKPDEASKKFYTKVAKDEAKPMQMPRMPAGVNYFPQKIYPKKSLDNDMAKGSESMPRRKDVPYIKKRESQDELSNVSMITDCAWRRSFKIQQMNNFSLSMNDIPGTDEIQLGKVIEFYKPHISHNTELINKKSGRFDDRFISGNYLVTRLKHCLYIKPGDSDMSYSLGAEFVKDLFVEPVSYKNMEGW